MFIGISPVVVVHINIVFSYKVLNEGCLTPGFSYFIISLALGANSCMDRTVQVTTYISKFNNEHLLMCLFLVAIFLNTHCHSKVWDQ